MKLCYSLLFLALAAPGYAQAPSSGAGADKKQVAVPAQTSAQTPADKLSDEASAVQVPTKTLDFKIRDSAPHIELSPVTSVPVCDAEGTLFIDIFDPQDLTKHNLVSVEQSTTHSYPIAAITDLHDVYVNSFFPSDSVVAFLVRATKEIPGTPGPGKSPAGVAWKDYHKYIAEFDRKGVYKQSVELPINYEVQKLAVFANGDFLVAGYDHLNSALRLVYLDSSGRLVRTLDSPAGRRATTANLPARSVEEAKAVTALLGSINFTTYKNDILVWTRNSSDPILDVSPGGGVREVPVEVPPGFVFAEMIPASDRWVAHFRSARAAEHAPFNSVDYAYYQLRPQDGSLEEKLVISGEDARSIACEADGTYIAFSRDKDNKLSLLSAGQ